VIAVAFLSTAGQVFGPKILGNGINKIMDGIVGKQMGQLPAGTTHAQAVEMLKQAHSPLADLGRRDQTRSPASASISAPSERSARPGALYLAATFFSWVAWYTMAGVAAAHRLIRLRRDVDQKLADCPSSISIHISAATRSACYK